MSTTKRRKVKAKEWGRELVGYHWMLGPRTAETYDAMAEQIARRTAVYCDDDEKAWGGYIGYAQAALRAIGITRPKETHAGARQV